jgi:hypothetical protein
MTPCNDHRDQLLLLRAGALDDDALRTDLLDHLDRGCPECARYLAEADETLGELLIGAGLIKPAPTVKARLMDRIRSVRNDPAGHIGPPQQGGLADTPTHPRHRLSGRLRRFMPLAASAVIGSAATFAIMMNEINNFRTRSRPRQESRSVPPWRWNRLSDLSMTCVPCSARPRCESHR